VAVQEKNLLPGLGVPVSRRCRDSSLPRVLGVSPNSPISPQEWGTRGLKAVYETVSGSRLCWQQETGVCKQQLGR